MEWQGLEWDFNPSKVTLPKILAGPILRRVEPSNIWIWLATSFEPARVEGVVPFPPGKEPAPLAGNVPLGTGGARTVKLGDQLFIHLIRVRPQILEEFPTGTILRYSVRVQEEEGDSLEDVREFGSAPHLSIRSSRTDLCKHFGSDSEDPNFEHPTFVIQGQQQHLRALYGSCRKLHGDGPDATTAAYEILRCFAGNEQKRPQSLFLMGDQIYADDVSDLLISYIARLGVALTGSEEALPDIESLPVNMIRGRGRILDQLSTSPFTSGSKANHLIRFGEYAAMYLLSWNPRLWPNSWPDKSEYVRQRQNARPFFNESIPPEKELRSQFDEAKNRINLVRGRDSARATQQLFANISCYMNFDDHEVTDDWNLNPAWEQRMANSSAGRRITTNALAAFWAFQRWGNDPENSPSNAQLINVLEEHLGEGAGSEQAYEDSVQGYENWSFSTATHPPAFFIDSRTRRSRALAKRQVFNEEVELRPPASYPWYIASDLGLTQPPSIDEFAPRLLETSAKADIAKMIARFQESEHGPTIIVTGGPVLGFELVELLQDLLSKLAGSGTWKDLEAWSSNIRSLLDFFEIVSTSQNSHTIVLSGDVHYAYGVQGKLRSNRFGINKTIFQFTSSALQNISAEPWKSIAADVLSADMNRTWFWKSGKQGLVEVFDEAAYRLEQISDMISTATKSAVPGSTIFDFPDLISPISDLPDFEPPEEAVEDRVEEVGPFDFKLERKYIPMDSNKYFERHNNIGLLTIAGPRLGRNQIFVYDAKRGIRIGRQFRWPQDSMS